MFFSTVRFFRRKIHRSFSLFVVFSFDSKRFSTLNGDFLARFIGTVRLMRVFSSIILEQIENTVGFTRDCATFTEIFHPERSLSGNLSSLYVFFRNCSLQNSFSTVDVHSKPVPNGLARVELRYLNYDNTDCG